MGPKSKGTHVIVVIGLGMIACSPQGASIDAGTQDQQAPVITSTNVPDQCGSSCSATDICVLATVRFGMQCGLEWPVLCDAGVDAAGTCSTMCARIAACQAPPNGCASTDCECLVRNLCLETNQVGSPCGGFCDVTSNHAQVACLSCN